MLRFAFSRTDFLAKCGSGGITEHRSADSEQILCWNPGPDGAGQCRSTLIAPPETEHRGDLKAAPVLGPPKGSGGDGPRR
jgi:hypothetical protein